jgi:hypothetical protein
MKKHDPSVRDKILAMQMPMPKEQEKQIITKTRA